METSPVGPEMNFGIGFKMEGATYLLNMTFCWVKIRIILWLALFWE